MKKRIYIIIGISILAVASVTDLIYGANRGEDVFNGSKLCNRNEFLLVFSYMNRNDEHTIHMRSGDTLKVTYEIKNGRTDVVIGIIGHDPIYRGNDIQTGSFELPIRETGDYIISVTADKASGKTDFSAERQYS